MSIPKQENKSAQTKNNLVSTVTHKLKSPLTTINLYTEALLSGTVGKITPEQRDYIKEIHKASKKMVQNVSDLSKIINEEIEK